MSDTLTLSAETRDRVGKGASRALRNEGRVPAVVYGAKKEPMGISVNERELMKLLNTGHFMNSIVMIDAGGKPVRTLPKDVTFDVVTDRPLHVDFLRITAHATVTVAVPINFVDEDEAPGITKGGVLNIVSHELELTCDASEIPSEITVSLKGLDIGDTIHLSDITLPKGTEASIEDQEFTVATVIAPSAMKADVQEALAEDAALAAEAAAEQQAEEAAIEAGEEPEGEEPNDDDNHDDKITPQKKD